GCGLYVRKSREVGFLVFRPACSARSLSGMLPGVIIAVGSLVLRPVVEADAPAIWAACDDPLTARRLPLIPSPYTLEDAHAYVRRAEAVWESGGAEFTITEDGRYAGSAWVTPLTPHGS